MISNSSSQTKEKAKKGKYTATTSKVRVKISAKETERSIAINLMSHKFLHLLGEVVVRKKLEWLCVSQFFGDV